MAGELDEFALGERGRFRRSEFIVRPAFSAHWNRVGAEAATYVRLPLSSGAIRRFLREFGWRPMRGSADPVDLDLASRVRLSEGGDDLLGLATTPAYEPPADDTPLEAIARQLASERPPSLNDVAETLGLVPYQLTRQFTRRFGLSPASFRREARLRRVMALLAADTGPLSRIAVEAGYYDQSHLNRELKWATGLTPRTFASVWA